VGGSDFSNEDDVGSLGSGATVLKLQVSLDSNWSQRGNIMETLTDLASRKGSSINSRSDISSLLSEASIALLRRESDWNSATIDGEVFNGGNNAIKAEPFYQKLAITERTKFEKESIGTIRSSNVVSGSLPTQAVVSILVAIRGKSEAYKKNVSNTREVKEILQSLASEALTDEGENIMAVEVLWTPSEVGNVLSERDIVQDYPELIRL
jgi:uncharacterized membrane protein